MITSTLTALSVKFVMLVLFFFGACKQDWEEQPQLTIICSVLAAIVCLVVFELDLIPLILSSF